MITIAGSSPPEHVVADADFLGLQQRGDSLVHTLVPPQRTIRCGQAARARARAWETRALRSGEITVEDRRWGPAGPGHPDRFDGADERLRLHDIPAPPP